MQSKLIYMLRAFTKIARIGCVLWPQACDNEKPFHFCIIDSAKQSLKFSYCYQTIEVYPHGKRDIQQQTQKQVKGYLVTVKES